MKKLLALAMAALLLLSLVGCSSPEEPGEFDYIVELLEEEDYEEAIEEIYDLMGKDFEGFDEEAEEEAQPDRTEEPSAEEIAPEEAPVEEPVSEEAPAEEPVSEEIPEPEAAPAQKGVPLLVKVPVVIVDNLGNESTDTLGTYTRNAQGAIEKISGHDFAIAYGFYLHTFADYLELTYAADGKIENVKVTDAFNTVNALGTPAYDENGNMVSMHVVTNTEEYDLTFDYDANGNCIRADIFDTFWEEISFEITYTYDAEGRLLSENWDMVGFGNTGRTVDYTYDENGNLLQSYTTWHEYTPWHETTVYTLDENGNPVSSETTSDTTESGYSRKTAEYIYEYYAVAPWVLKFPSNQV